MATQITCRIDETFQDNGKEGTVITFLKTSEEAKCSPIDDISPCDWTYVQPSATLLTRELTFDNSRLEWLLTITGYGFSDSAQLYIGENLQ
jgi:hypothetical protein